MTTARIQSNVLFEKFWQLVLSFSSKPTSRIISGFLKVQGTFRSPNSSEIHWDLTVWSCLLSGSVVTMENSVITQKHLLDRLELFICPCRNKSRNTVKMIVITCSSSYPYMGVSEDQRWGFVLNPGASGRQARHSIFTAAWMVTLRLRGFPLQQRCWGDCSLPCFLLPMIKKGLHSSDVVQCSLPDLKCCWLHNCSCSVNKIEVKSNCSSIMKCAKRWHS